MPKLTGFLHEKKKLINSWISTLPTQDAGAPRHHQDDETILGSRIGIPS